MTDLFAATDSGIFVPTRLRTQVIPWEALKALNPPVTQPQVSTDMLSAFAVLVAQGPRAPALVETDEHNNLLVNAEINQHTTVGRAQNPGDTVLMVSDPTYGGAGDVFLVFPVSGTASHGPYQVAGAGQDVDGTIHLTSALSQSVAVGDGVRRLPLVGFSNALNFVQINGSIALPVVIQAGGIDLQLATFAFIAGPVTNAVQSVVFGAASGFAFWLRYIMSSVFGNGGPTAAVSVRVHDGINSTDPVIFSYDHAVVAANGVDRQYMPKLGITSSIGNGLRVDFSGTGATTQETVSAGGSYK